MRAITGEADTDLITVGVNHGLHAGERVVFRKLAGGTGLSTTATYYVIATGLTDKDFKVSATDGGSAVDFTDDITAGYFRRFFTGGKRFIRT